MSESPREFLVLLRAEPAERDALGREPELRLRLLLKIAGRGLGLRALQVTEDGKGVEEKNPLAGRGDGGEDGN